MNWKIGIVVLAAIVPLMGCAAPQGGTVADKRRNVDRIEKTTLEMAYEKRPALKIEVERAAGYAVFSNVNVMVLFVGGGSGYGVVVDKETKERTYMRMSEGDLGIGLGAKDFRMILVFSDTSTLHEFMNSGWQFGAGADAAVKSDTGGGAASTAGDTDTGIRIYQFTTSGAIASANVQGTKYWRDGSLNE